LSGQFKHKGLAVIPEIRLDNDNSAAFLESDGLTATKKAAQASIAFVYAF